MLLFYIRAFLQKCRQKIAQPKELEHVTWPALFAYTVRQAWHTYRGTYTGSLETCRRVSEKLTRMETPYGAVYLSGVIDKREIRYLLREAFDPKHWHQYRTKETPLGLNDIVVDCGPSEGLWGLTASAQVKKIYLIEPQQAFIEALEKTFAKQIKQGKAQIINSAVGAIDGRCQMIKKKDADPMAVAVAHQAGETKLSRLDTVFENQPVTFIKADIEGAEMELLKGAKNIILRDKPKMALTVYHDENDWRAMRDYVVDLVPQYQWRLKGMLSWGKPLMLHMWVAS